MYGLFEWRRRGLCVDMMIEKGTGGPILCAGSGGNELSVQKNEGNKIQFQKLSSSYEHKWFIN